MKNLIKSKNYLFISLIFLFIINTQCSKDEDSNGNSTITVVPLVPSNLTGTIVNNQVILTWTDNSTNETGFKIERMTDTGNWSVNGSVATDITTYIDAGATAGTAYTYRVYSFNTAGNSLNYSNLFPITIPLVTTTTVTSITPTTAASGGSITLDGGVPVTARGVVWSTNTTPTIELSTKTTDGAGTGSFSSVITTLSANTNYHLRAYATNSLGTAYGNEVIITTALPYYTQGGTINDIDGNSYPTIIINCSNQIWMQKNLDVSHYRNGDVIPQVTDPTAWANLTTGAWCYYTNNSYTGTTYGKLYNWYAVDDSRGLAPTGWHVPTDAEWTTLTDCLGGEAVAGGKMKETTLWISPNTDASNSSNFTGLPGGFRGSLDGTFYAFHEEGGWWVSSEYDSGIGRFGGLSYNSGVARLSANIKSIGFSVRCVRD